MSNPAQSNAPIQYQECAQLQRLGVAPGAIGFSTVSLNSDRFICVREKLDDRSQLAIVDTAVSPAALSRKSISADAAIMNPAQQILALRSASNLQVFNLETRAKLAAVVFNEEIVFWKWIDESVIGLVTRAAVYHWTVAAGSGGSTSSASSSASPAPVKVFNLESNMLNTQIMNYFVDAQRKWCVLVGVTASPQGKIVGAIQLFSVERNISQPIVGHAARFTQFKLDENPNPSNIFIFAVKDDANNCKMHIIEVGAPAAGNQPFRKRVADIPAPNANANDFPISIHADNVSGVIYILTKAGFVYLFEMESATCFYASQISQEVVFTSVNCNSVSKYGLFAVNRSGVAFAVSLNPNNVLPYCRSKNMEPIGLKIAERCGFPGGEQAVMAKFNALFGSGNFDAAAKLVASRPILRNPQTMQLFINAGGSGGPAPILLYFSALLEMGKLNLTESIELCRPVIAQGKVNLLEKWLKEDKLECSEQLGDLAKTADNNLAMSIYVRCNATQKVMACFAETGQFQKLVLYANKVGAPVDLTSVVGRICATGNFDGALEFCKMYLNGPEPKKLTSEEIMAVVNVFGQFPNATPQCTAFLLEAMKEDTPEFGDLQTKILEMNLLVAPQVAEAIFVSRKFSHYDRAHIARLCEQSGLLQRAIEHYTDLYDIKRALVHTHLLSPDFLVAFFGSLSVDDSLDCLELLLNSNIMQNLKVVVAIASKYYQQLTPHKLINLFESVRSYEGMFLFLGSIVNFSEDSDVHFKYIQAATKIGQMKELERIIKESNFYPPEEVKNFLKETKLADHLPLIIVCDRFDYVHELILHLYNLNAQRYIEMYVCKVNPARLPIVVGYLLDFDAGDDFIRQMIVNVPGNYDMTDLVDEVSKRNRMMLLRPLLEHRIYSTNSTDSNLHSALAMVYVDMNLNADKYLQENQYYDCAVVGRFCSKRGDVKLAWIAYEKGGCDFELIEATVTFGLYRNLARYLISKKDINLWKRVLQNEDQLSLQVKLLIEQVQIALPEIANSTTASSIDPEVISVTVKAFMSIELGADNNQMLLELLERLILSTGDNSVSRHRNLQNLLLLTAMKSNDRELTVRKLNEYIEKLDNYEVDEIADIAVKQGYTEQAFLLYKKNNQHSKALSILLTNIDTLPSEQMALTLEKATEYSEKVNTPEVYSILAAALLKTDQVKKSISVYIKASDFTAYMSIIAAAKKSGNFKELLDFLNGARSQLLANKNLSLSAAAANSRIDVNQIDNNICYCFARLDQIEDLRQFVNNTSPKPHVKCDQIGELCYEEKLYQAARVLFEASNNYPKLALACLRCKEYSLAVEMARKANKLSTWREVNAVCLEMGEYKLARVAGLYLIMNPEELTQVVRHYEKLGLFDELIELLEAGVGLERAHSALFTELAIAYSNYNPAKLRDHIDSYCTRFNIPKVIKAVALNEQWPELAVLYEKYEDYDGCFTVMLDHFEVVLPVSDIAEGTAIHTNITNSHMLTKFKDVAIKVSNMDLLYSGASKLHEFAPLYLSDYLIPIANKLDASRIILMMQAANAINLVVNYLKTVQTRDISLVNETLNNLYLEKGRYEDLRESVGKYQNCDLVTLAGKLEEHELLEMRRVANLIYRRINRYERAIEICQRDNLYVDAVQIAAESRSFEEAHRLLEYYTTQKNPEGLLALCYECYDLLKPDDVLERVWKANMFDYAMPYLIQTMNDLNQLLVKTAEQEKEKQESSSGSVKEQASLLMRPTLMITNTQAPAGMQPGGFRPF